VATYYDINGQKVQNLASDPSPVQEGQVWYNTTSNTAKVEGLGTASWASGGALGTGGMFGTNGAGTQTTGLVYARLQEAGPTPGYKTNTESYNGTAWSELNDMNTGRNAAAGGGTQTSALCAGGQPGIPGIVASENWDGSCWTTTPSLNTGRSYLAGAIQSSTAGIAFGGMGPPTGVALTELYNGSTWSEVADLNTARRSNAGVGSSTAALGMGGYVTGNVANCESWDGSCWTNVNNQSNAGGGSAFGTLASAVKTSGSGNVVELWDGTNWSSGTNVPVLINNRSGVGTSSLGLLTGGEPPNSGVTTTNEYTGAGPVTQTITTS
jgi:hypothetical protein